MIYVLAILVPPLALLFNGQPIAALLNFVLWIVCLILGFLGLFLGFLSPMLWLLPIAHAIISIHMTREERRHREIVEAIERHGPTPGYGR